MKWYNYNIWNWYSVQFIISEQSIQLIDFLTVLCVKYSWYKTFESLEELSFFDDMSLTTGSCSSIVVNCCWRSGKWKSVDCSHTLENSGKTSQLNITYHVATTWYQQVKEFYGSQQIKEFYGCQQVKEFYGCQQIKEFYGCQQIKVFYGCQQVKEFYGCQQIKEFYGCQQIKEFYGCQQIKEFYGYKKNQGILWMSTN